ncbi:MAG: galactose-1-phosphate uridylyltransferase [Candidatus Parcubacteria bacterium]|nr:galactose-1-phosphate uridylyltransferase [Candidatus Parcubacteria bacterium]
MPKNKKNNLGLLKMEAPSELRFDLISGDWVVIATGRARRPETFKKEKREKEEVSKKLCPFCNINNQEEPTLIYSKGKKVLFKLGKEVPKNWTTVVIPNKYPAFVPYLKLEKKSENHLFQRMNAVGFHEVVITRDHKKSLAHMSISRVKEVIDVFQARFKEMANEKFVNYVSIFHNHGAEAGATITHPHSQIVTTPLIDSDLKKALVNSRNYLSKNKQCIYCRMMEWEKKNRERIVFENENFLAVCPFASKSAFEVIISPKKHLSYFEKITEKEKIHLAEALHIVLKKLYKGLNNPAYNFYLHTAPCDGNKHDYYHWHWTILPKTSTWAGFEIGTKIEISTIEPEKAAEFLRKQ